ncbi:uncharacterized protein LOC131941808 [Physella acuta]|uniref:uncharacterized protein LOC131941808 n=1 Tax=Physella acuta TaxID=109671 RepID=UPI0027DB403C|nr:uncharacterized protein LOC131941808 [Physella acuta]XP_059157330.1 uncharacterized protein LOC131941808 [Physella acuta]
MATDAGQDKEYINYVAKMRFSKEMINKENTIRYKIWPNRCGFIMPIYHEMNLKLDQGRLKPLPSSTVRVTAADFAHLWPLSATQSQKPKSLMPQTHAQLIGWKAGNSIVETTDKWVKPASRYNMYKDLGWGVDSLW